MSQTGSIRIETVKNWQKDYPWLELECNKTGGVKTIFCSLCKKHEARLRAVRNFNRSFIDGSSGALKKDNVVKHNKSDMHTKAMTFDTTHSLSEIYA